MSTLRDTMYLSKSITVVEGDNADGRPRKAPGPAVTQRTSGAATPPAVNADGRPRRSAGPVGSSSGATANFQADGKHVAPKMPTAQQSAANPGDFVGVGDLPGFSAMRGDADILRGHGVELAIKGGLLVVGRKDVPRAAQLLQAIR